MKKRDIVEIGIKLIGIAALITALTHGMSFLQGLFRTWNSYDDGLFSRDYYLENTVAFFLDPIIFFLVSILFGRKLASLVTNEGGEVDIGINSRELLKITVLIFGLYCVVTGVSGTVSYLYELSEVQNGEFGKDMVTIRSSIFYNVLWFLSGVILLSKASQICKVLDSNK